MINLVFETPNIRLCFKCNIEITEQLVTQIMLDDYLASCKAKERLCLLDLFSLLSL